MAADVPTTKRCTKCSVIQPVSEFGRQACRKDGLNPWCRSCKKAASAAYFLVKREQIMAAAAVWRKANPEKSRAYGKKWREANPEKAKAVCDDYVKRHPEKRRAWSRAYYHKKSPEERREISRRVWERGKHKYRLTAAKWRALNPDLCRQHHRNYKAKKRNAEGSHSKADVLRIFDAQKGRCAYCRKSLHGGYHVDHIKPLDRGGSNFPRNLQLTCAFCNISKKNRDPLQHARIIGRLL